MTFFYDESGNCRKFYLKNDEVNSVVTVNSMDALKGDFVLAGVAFDGFEKEIDIKGLYQALNYKEGQKELKFKHLYYKSNDFISFMKSKRATEFLQWLNDSGLYIHYSALNNLYYSLVDIVDSLYDIFPQYVQSFDMIKSALYDFAYENFDEMIRLLYEFNYPNVTDCQNFCNALCEAISMHSEYHHNHHLCLLTKMLKRLD